MTQQELETFRMKFAMGIQAIMGEEPETEQDEYGFYSTGTFQWKGKFIIITKDDGKWHLSASAKHIMGYYELKELRYTFLPNRIEVAQIFPPREEFVNLAENCLHLYEI